MFRAARFFGLVLAFVAIAILLSTSNSPVAFAQGPGMKVSGETIFPSATAGVNISELARREILNPLIPQLPRVPQRPLNIPDIISSDAIVESGAPRVVNAPNVASPSPSQSFQALTDANFSIPPDTNGAVGPNHLMVTSNERFRMMSRTGGVLSTVNQSAFWAALSGSHIPFDNKILYDPFGNRWILTATSNSNLATSELLIAVSQTNDPTGNWNLFAFDADATNIAWADFPSIGFNTNWIAVSVNMFKNSDNTFVRGQLYVFNKANLYANSTVGTTVFNTGIVPFTLAPAVTLDNSITTLHLLRHISSAGGTIAKSTITGSASSPTLSVDTATITSGLGPWAAPCSCEFLPQLGDSRQIDIGDARMRNVVIRTIGATTSLWATQTIALPAGSSPTHGAVQWWQLDSNPVSTTILQQARIEDTTATQANSGKHYAYPSIAVNKNGDALLGYSRFSLAEYASAAYSLRWNSTRLNAMCDDALLKAGLGPYVKTFTGTVNRWGDFSGTVVDPSDDTMMWTIQEYAETSVGTGNGSGRWGLWWGQIQAGGNLVTPSPSQTFRLFLPIIQTIPC